MHLSQIVFILLLAIVSPSVGDGPPTDLHFCAQICEELTGPCECVPEKQRIHCTDDSMETANLCADTRFENDTFTSVTLNENLITRLQPDQIMPEINDQILNLDVSENMISQIDDGAFQGFVSLQTLILATNNLTQIRAATFMHLSKLQMLDIRGNLIRDLTGGPFVHLKSLQKIYLDNNPITKIDAQTFTPLTRLVSISIDGARLETIEQEWFEGLNELQTLSIANNRLTSVPQMTLPRLTLLTLSGNQIRTIPTDAFQGFDSLEWLRLDSMDELERVEDCAFCHLLSLKTLVVAHCPKLSQFSSAAFGSTVPREHLDISNNAITTLAANTVQWKKITKIQLQMNPWHCNCSVEWISELNTLEAPKCKTPPSFEGKDIRLLHPDDLHCPYNHSQTTLVVVLLVLLVAFLAVFSWFVFPGQRAYKDRCSTLCDRVNLPGYSYKNLTNEGDRNNLVINDYLDERKNNCV